MKIVLRYKQIEVVKLDDVMENWKLEGSILSQTIIRIDMETECSCSTVIILDNVGDTWKDKLNGRKSEIQSLMIGQNIFWCDEMSSFVYVR